MPTDRPGMAQGCIECKLGVVVALDREKGTLTLAYGDGTCADLKANPGLLADLRIGGPVQVTLDGTNVLTLRPL